jgi:hypothetical protein
LAQEYQKQMDKADFLVPAVYGKQDARSQLKPAIEKAIHIMDEAVKQVTDLMQDRCEQFLDEMTKALIASQIILKHPDRPQKRCSPPFA